MQKMQKKCKKKKKISAKMVNEVKSSLQWHANGMNVMD